MHESLVFSRYAQETLGLLLYQFATTERRRYPKPTAVRIELGLGLPSVYQEYLVAFKLMTSPMVQRARPF